jgi:hypothetical protein
MLAQSGIVRAALVELHAPAGIVVSIDGLYRLARRSIG